MVFADTFNQHVGNFPGVTVDRTDGIVRGHPNIKVTDLPGIYSLSPYSREELVTRDFLLKEHPNAIINIVDASSIERSLFLTLQLLDLRIPMVIALNMMDEIRLNGASIDINRLEKMLGIPVIPISALKNEGVRELIEHAENVARYREIPDKVDFCLCGGKEEGAVHRCIHSIAHLIEHDAARAGIPLRFAASKLTEGDEPILKSLKIDQEHCRILDQIVAQMEQDCGMDREAAMADMRFSFIGGLCKDCVIKPAQSRERARSEKIDRILTGKWTALPVFLLLMALVFYLSFGPMGTYLSGLVEKLIDSKMAILNAAGDIIMTSGFTEDNGVFYSNSTYKIARVRHGSYCTTNSRNNNYYNYGGSYAWNDYDDYDDTAYGYGYGYNQGATGKSYGRNHSTSVGGSNDVVPLMRCTIHDTIEGDAISDYCHSYQERNWALSAEGFLYELIRDETTSTGYNSDKVTDYALSFCGSGKFIDQSNRVRPFVSNFFPRKGQFLAGSSPDEIMSMGYDDDEGYGFETEDFSSMTPENSDVPDDEGLPTSKKN